jgi:signal transduction histidine kinase
MSLTDCHRLLGERPANRRAACLGLVVLFLTWTAIAARGDGVKQILVLHSNQNTLPAIVIADAAIRRELQARLPGGVNIFSEAMDSERFPGPDQEARLDMFLRGKYAKYAIDLVIATSFQALDFVLQRRGTSLFANAHIVFAGVSEKEARARVLPDGISGLVSRYGLDASLQLASRLQSDVRHLIIVSGASAEDKTYEAAARALRPSNEQLDVSYLSGLPMPDLLHELANLPAHSIVLYLTVLQDGAGQAFIPADVAEKIARTANAPVYGIFDTYVGRGIVGGNMDTVEALGTGIAQLGLRVLAGERPDPLTLAPSSNIVDWRQLRRWGLRESDLPPDSVVRFKEPSLWESYWWQIVLAGALLIVQSFLIIALLLQGRRRRRAERAARESEERVSVATASANLGLWQWDVESNQLWASDICRQILGLSSHPAVTLEAFLAVVRREDLIKRPPLRNHAMAQDSFEEVEHLLVWPDGSEHWIRMQGRTSFDALGRPARVTGAVIDVTPAKKVEQESALWRQELMHLTRVATLGELSGAMAHELNQPLTAILSNADAARLFLSQQNYDPTEVREILADIATDAARGGEIIQHLRALFSKTSTLIQPLSLNEVVTEVLRLLNSDLVARRVIVTTMFALKLPMVQGDRVQIQQVLLNLIFNACDAMAENEPSDRKLTVGTATEGSNAAQISITDWGRGIDADILDRLFKPFVTTKSRGLGLGLSICHSIVEAHGGRLWAFNGPQCGATFCVALPGSERAAL